MTNNIDSPKIFSATSTSTSTRTSPNFETKLRHRLRSLFDTIDSDHSGYIEERELQKAFLSLDIHLSQRQIKELVGILYFFKYIFYL